MTAVLGVARGRRQPWPSMVRWAQCQLCFEEVSALRGDDVAVWLLEHTHYPGPRSPCWCCPSSRREAEPPGGRLAPALEPAS